MKYLLDTDHISILFYESGSEYEAICLQVAAHEKSEVGVSIVSFHEQFLGCHAFLNKQRRQAKILEGYARMMKLFRLYAIASIVPYLATAAVIFDDLLSLNLRVSKMDLRITAIALASDLTLVTRNVADFSQIPDLRTEDWTI